jgi:hypothetical protein
MNNTADTTNFQFLETFVKMYDSAKKSKLQIAAVAPNFIYRQSQEVDLWSVGIIVCEM